MRFDSIADQARTIRNPVHKIVRTTRQMMHEIGREPTPEELVRRSTGCQDWMRTRRLSWRNALPGK